MNCGDVFPRIPLSYNFVGECHEIFYHHFLLKTQTGQFPGILSFSQRYSMAKLEFACLTSQRPCICEILAVDNTLVFMLKYCLLVSPLSGGLKLIVLDSVIVFNNDKPVF